MIVRLGLLRGKFVLCDGGLAAMTMNDKLDILLTRMRELEGEIKREIQCKEGEFLYKVRKQKVCFTEEARAQHRKLAKKLHRTVLDSKPLVLLTAPIVWMCLLPFVLLDVATLIFQAICFPIYGIPRVRRRDYILIDRHQLSYLNGIEKINCIYCSYANGLLAYITEIAARTEQYWCPIKHALKINSMHSRYGHFFDYGDAEDYRKRIEKLRRSFHDLEPQPDQTPDVR